MMRKASAITLSIFIMMIVLAVLLGYTAYYVDQVVIRPVVLMQDAEVGLKCFFALSNIIGGEYVREGEPVPEGSLRSDLMESYQISNVQELYLGDYQDIYEESLALMYGDAEVIIRNDQVFWQAVRSIPVTCYLSVYGPVRIGTAGLFTQRDVIEAANREMDFWQERLYGEVSVFE